MIRGIKTLFSKELKDLNKAFDDIIKMKKIDGMKEKISDLGKALKDFAKLKVTQKAGKGAESQWVNKNETKDVYANIYGAIYHESALLHDELYWRIDVERLHQWYRLSPTISTFPWYRCKLATATILTAYLIAKSAFYRSREEINVINGKAKFNGVPEAKLVEYLEKTQWKPVLKRCEKLVKNKKKLDTDDPEIKTMIDKLKSDIT